MQSTSNQLIFSSSRPGVFALDHTTNSGEPCCMHTIPTLYAIVGSGHQQVAPSLDPSEVRASNPIGRLGQR